LHKVELPDWTHILAEGAGTEKSIDQQGSEKISKHDPRSDPNIVP
jgi:hypothetical protein